MHYGIMYGNIDESAIFVNSSLSIHNLICMIHGHILP